MNVLETTGMEGFHRALERGEAALALITHADEGQVLDRIETLCGEVLDRGRTPVVLAVGHVSPTRYPRAHAHHHNLASGRLLNEDDLLNVWHQTWVPNIDTTTAKPIDGLLVDLIRLMAAHTVWRRQRVGPSFGLTTLRQTALLDNLMAVLQPEMQGMDDPLSVRLMSMTRRYAHALGLTDEDIVQRDRAWPDAVMDRHGYNHMRITKVLGQAEELVEPLLNTSYHRPGWSAQGWLDRREVLIVGLGEHPGRPTGTPISIDAPDSTDHEHLSLALRWITADVTQGLPRDMTPRTLTLLDNDPSKLIGTAWLTPWSDHQALVNHCPTPALTQATHHRL